MIHNSFNNSIVSETALETGALALVGATEMEVGGTSRRLLTGTQPGAPVASLLDEISLEVPIGNERFGDLAELVLAGLGMVRGIPHCQLQVLFPNVDEDELDSRILDVLMEVRLSVWYFEALDRWQDRFVSSIEPYLQESVLIPVMNDAFVGGSGATRAFPDHSMKAIPICA